MNKVLRKDAQVVIKNVMRRIRASKLLDAKIHYDGHKLSFSDQSIPLDRFRRILVAGAGKCAGDMARGLEKKLGARIHDGLVIVPFGHDTQTQRIHLLKGDHPIPDINSIQSTRMLLEFLDGTTEDDLVIFLLTGGASALLEQLPPENTLSDIKETTKTLLRSGMPIEQMNSERTKFSLVKGGKLLQWIDPAACLNIVMSDVIGDLPEAIGSGPTWSVQRAFAKNQFYWWQIGNNRNALEIAAEEVAKLGYRPVIADEPLSGNAEEAGKRIAKAMEKSPTQTCLLFGGETTVQVLGHGKGGRVQEMALSLFAELESFPETYYGVCISTDGVDGPTDAAGAAVFPQIWEKVKAKGLNPREYLQRNDSYSFWKLTEAAIKTGPTGSNLNDLVMIFI